jgi:hypothetical protein
MIIILVFTLAAAICTQIFARAFNMSVESRELTMSSINAQTVAEQFKAGVSGIPPLYFDRDWATADEAGAYYIIRLNDRSVTKELKDAYVDVYKKGGDEAFYSLHVKEFVG